MITTIEKNQILTIWLAKLIQSRDEVEVGALHFLGSKKRIFEVQFGLIQYAK